MWRAIACGVVLCMGCGVEPAAEDDAGCPVVEGQACWSSEDCAAPAALCVEARGERRCRSACNVPTGCKSSWHLCAQLTEYGFGVCLPASAAGLTWACSSVCDGSACVLGCAEN